MKELLQQIENHDRQQKEQIRQLTTQLDKQTQNAYNAKQESDNLRKQAYVIRQKVKKIQKLILNNKIDTATILLAEIDTKLGRMYFNPKDLTR